MRRLPLRTRIYTAPVHPLEKIQVMILEGSNQTADLVKNIFSQFGFNNTYVAHDGFEGVQLMKKVRIDMIFTDSELKVHPRPILRLNHDAQHAIDALPVSGIQFVKRLRQSPFSPNPFIPVVMLMDQLKAEEVAEARDAGINELIPKPLCAQDFCRKIIDVIDHPRIFITAHTYKGPCRRRLALTLPDVIPERRKKDIRLVRREER